MMKRRTFVLGLLFAGLAAPPATAAFGDKVQFDIQLPTDFERQAQSSPEPGVEAVRFVGRRRRVTAVSYPGHAAARHRTVMAWKWAQFMEALRLYGTSPMSVRLG